MKTLQDADAAFSIKPLIAAVVQKNQLNVFNQGLKQCAQWVSYTKSLVDIAKRAVDLSGACSTSLV